MTQTLRIAALIVAAGNGVRVGGEIPKQYQMIGRKPMLAYSIEALCSHPAIGAVAVVVGAGHEYLATPIVSLCSPPKGEQQSAMRDAVGGIMHSPPTKTAGAVLTPPRGGGKLIESVIGGARRQDSVRAGLQALVDFAPDYVMIHDAARPFLSHAMIDALVARLAPDVAVLPVLDVADTVRREENGRWQDVPRVGLKRMQTPQCFPYAMIRALHAQQTSDATDDAALWLEAGRKLGYVEGDERLRKVTTAADMVWANQHVARTPRSGMGFDVHRLVPHAADEEKVIRLGGIAIAHEAKLDGHSDADVVLHAITDALLGTIAAADIGAHFPPSDPQWKGARSEVFLRHAAHLVREAGGEIAHVDVTLMCEAPKIAPHREAMRARIAELLDVQMAQVSVKATTTEGLGFTGRREGIAAQALVNVMMEGAT